MSVVCSDKRKRLIIYLLLLLIVSLVVHLNINKFPVINITNSIDGYIFIKDDSYSFSEIKKGDLIAFKHNHSEYKPYRNLLKRVYGVSGDLVEFKKGHVFVAGKDLGKVYPMGSGGVPLKQIEGGVIPSGKLFVGSEKDMSFDSRYKRIGLIDEKQVISTVHAFF